MESDSADNVPKSAEDPAAAAAAAADGTNKAALREQIERTVVAAQAKFDV